MKKRWKNLITSMLIVCLLFNSIVAAGVKDVKAEQATGESADSDMSEEYDVKLTYDVTGTWDGHSNVEVKITNILDEKIEDWEIKIPADFEIKNIWNAAITEIFEGEDEQDTYYYDLENAVHNQNIEAGQSVEFGFIVKCQDKVEITNHELFEMGMISEDYMEEDLARRRQF